MLCCFRFSKRFCGLVFFTCVLLYTWLLLAFSRIPDYTKYPAQRNAIGRNNLDNKHNRKYILVWPAMYPFNLLKDRDTVSVSTCEQTNCFFTENEHYFKDPSVFDAIVFSGVSVSKGVRLPLESRSLSQKYVFATRSPAPEFLMMHSAFDNSFNWTFTYRLNSTFIWSYFTVYDMKGNIVGPAIDVKWPEMLEAIDDSLKKKLDRKTEAVAWFGNFHHTHSRKEMFAVNFKTEFSKLGYKVHVYKNCSHKFSESCSEMLEKQYRFYFSFEDYWDEDYVTDHLLIAVNNLVVPIVYGGANYSRFLPPGSYLNAWELGPKNLAIAIKKYLEEPHLYYDFFRWRNYLTYKASEGKEICKICSALYNATMLKTSVIRNFRRWWHTSTKQKTFEFLLRNIMYSEELRLLAAQFDGSSRKKRELLNRILNQSVIPKETLYFEYYLNSLNLPDLHKETPLNLYIPTYDFNFTTLETTETFDPELVEVTATDSDSQYANFTRSTKNNLSSA